MPAKRSTAARPSQQRVDLGVGHAGGGLQLLHHPVAADLLQLVDHPEHLGRDPGQLEPGQRRGQHLAAVDAEADGPDPGGVEDLLDHHDQLGVGHAGLHPDHVEVALGELAVAAPLGVLASPHPAYVVEPHRRVQLAGVLGGEPGQRHGEVEPQPHLPAAVVGEPVGLAVGLVAALPEQDLLVLQGRSGDGGEAVALEDPAGRGQQGLAPEHPAGELVAEAAQGAGLDRGLRHGES
jgi:hypothetical protein